MSPEENRLDPAQAAELEAIDCALAGDPVDPAHAEIAELTVMLAGERPHLDPVAAARLDVRAAERFGRRTAGADEAPGSPPRTARRRWPAVLLAGGFAAATVAAILVISVVHGPSSTFTGPTGLPLNEMPARTATGSSATPSTAASPATGTATTASPAGAQAPGSASASLKTEGSAQIVLATDPDRIEAVAQEVFGAVRTAQGIVDQSTVTQTGGPDGSAIFQLRIPAGQLSATLARLSDLPGSHVTSRTDNTQDVTDTYTATSRALADARALRASLLRQLAQAAGAGQIAGLRAQLAGSERQISSDTARLRALDARISLTPVTVQISAGPAPQSGGFTLGRAAHLAGRVLVVAAGVGLVGLAVLVPLSILAALLGATVRTWRRRRREQALDYA